MTRLGLRTTTSARDQAIKAASATRYSKLEPVASAALYGYGHPRAGVEHTDDRNQSNDRGFTSIP